ncbi:MAG: efflux RND transporter permease subunit [Parabacteroides merdae]
MGEIVGPIVGVVLVLLAVFIPTTFISGISGQLYKQFCPDNRCRHRLKQVQLADAYAGPVRPVPASEQRTEILCIQSLQQGVRQNPENI